MQYYFVIIFMMYFSVGKVYKINFFNRKQVYFAIIFLGGGYLFIFSLPNRQNLLICQTTVV